MEVDHFRSLFAYNAWANGRILDHAERASEADYLADRPGLAFGSLHGTLAHLAGAERTWLTRWVRGPFAGRVRLAGLDAPDPDGLKAVRRDIGRLDSRLEAFVATLASDDLDRVVTYRAPNGVEYADPLHLQLAHLVNHGTQFRAEAAVRLSELGLSPGNIDLTVVLRGLK